MSEIWKKIEGFENYEISNLGRVRSIKKGKEKILKGGIDNNGYHHITLCKNGKVKTITIHKLVAIAFLNHIPNGFEKVVNHINFIKTDNRLENLEIVTTRENTNLKHLKSSSEFVGVYWCRRYKKWRSQIVINGKQRHLGYFINEAEAGEMYEIALANISIHNGNNKQFREILKNML